MVFSVVKNPNWNEETGWLELLKRTGHPLVGSGQRVWTHNDLEKLHQMKQVFSYRIPKECPFRHVDDFPLLKAGFSDSMCVFLWRMPYKYISRSLGWEIIVKFLQHLISECLLNSVQNWKVPYVTNAGWWTAKTSAPLRLRLYSLSWCLIYLVSSYPFGCNGMILWRQKPRNKRETAIYTPCTYTVCYVCLGSHNFFLQHHSILTGH